MPNPTSDPGTYWMTVEGVKAGNASYKCIVYLFPNALELDALPISPSNMKNRLREQEAMTGAQVPEAERLGTLAAICAREAAEHYSHAFVEIPRLPKMVQTDKTATTGQKEQKYRFAQCCETWVWQG